MTKVEGSRAIQLRPASTRKRGVVASWEARLKATCEEELRSKTVKHKISYENIGHHGLIIIRVQLIIKVDGASPKTYERDGKNREEAARLMCTEILRDELGVKVATEVMDDLPVLMYSS